MTKSHASDEATMAYGKGVKDCERKWQFEGIWVGIFIKRVKLKFILF